MRDVALIFLVGTMAWCAGMVSAGILWVWAFERALRREGAAEVLQSLVGKLEMFRGRRFKIDMSGNVTELPLDAAPRGQS